MPGNFFNDFFALSKRPLQYFVEIASNFAAQFVLCVGGFSDSSGRKHSGIRATSRGSPREAVKDFRGSQAYRSREGC